MCVVVMRIKARIKTGKQMWKLLKLTLEQILVPTMIVITTGIVTLSGMTLSARLADYSFSTTSEANYTIVCLSFRIIEEDDTPADTSVWSPDRRFTASVTNHRLTITESAKGMLITFQITLIARKSPHLLSHTEYFDFQNFRGCVSKKVSGGLLMSH